MKQNAYLFYYIDHIKQKFLDKIFEGKNSHKEKIDYKYVFMLPFIGTPSIQLKKKLKKIFKNLGIDINVIFSTVKVSSYFSLKDPTYNLLKSHLVYRFTCLDDPNITYIGKTKRFFQQRISEHHDGNTAISDHLKTCVGCKNNKQFSNQFEILEKGNNDFDIRILEALFISQLKPSLNKQLFESGVSFVLNIY